MSERPVGVFPVETFRCNVSVRARNLSPKEMRLNRFRNTFRVQSARLPAWDYTSPGSYAVTICTKNRECFLGVIEDETVQLSRCGQIVAEEWERTAALRPYISLDAWIVMPNHVHGIVVIRGSGVQGVVSGETRDERETTGERTGTAGEGTETFQRNVSTGGGEPSVGDDEGEESQAGPKIRSPEARLAANSLGSMIGQFKGASTKRILAEGIRTFGWQPRFYDQVIRTDAALDAIRTYISNNPLKWELDELNPAYGTRIDDDHNSPR